MERRTFFLASAAVITTASSASGHMIAGRGRCNSPTCYMCTHNNAHRSGRQHDCNGNWVRNQDYVNVVRSSGDNPNLELETVATTPQNVIKGMLKVIGPRQKDIFTDLGCGDGRICIQAARDYGCFAIGIERDKELVEIARENVQRAGLTASIIIREADILNTDLIYPSMREPDHKIFTMYLYSDLMDKVLSKLNNANTIVSLHHELKNSDLRFTVAKTPIYMRRNIM